MLLSIVLVGGFPLVTRSQVQPPKQENPVAPGQSPPANADAKAADQPAKAADQPAKPAPQAEIFRDPRAEKYLPNTFPQAGKSGPRQLASQVKSMAGGGTGVDRATIERFVNSCIADLTDHGNIRAVIDLQAGIPPGAGAHFAIQQATDNLIEPLLAARALNNGNFLTTYNQVLLQLLPPLLENHLLPRIEAMIVLSQTGSPEAVDIFVKQLNNPEQTVWVDLWAARGLTNVQQLSRYNLEAPRAIRAAKAVSDFLERERANDLPWPVQFRALEALGSLRLASTPQAAKGPEMASTATQFLTDPEGRLEVRAEAGWALGMMQVPAGISGYNFNLIAYSVGEVAAALGDRIHEMYPNNANQAEFWTGLLVAQVLQAFDGIDVARDSGLLKSIHPAAGQSRPFIKQVADNTKPIAAAAVKLVKGPGGQSQQNLQELEKRVTELKAWLQKNPPANASLVPNGPKFHVGGAQVVKAQPGGAAQVVRGSPGRGQ